MVDAAVQSALEAGGRICHPYPDAAGDAARHFWARRRPLVTVFHLDFWIGAAVVAGIYGIFTLGLQINVGFTGLINLGQAGFMSIGAYTMGLLVTEAGWSLWLAMPAAILVAVAAGLLVGLPSLRLRSDYFAIATIAFAEIVRDVFQNASFAGGNQGILGFDDQWRAVADRLATRFAAIGLGDNSQLPLFCAVWIVFLLLVAALRALQGTPWGRVLKAIREDEDAAAALGKNVLAYKLQSLAIAAALAAIAGFFLALNVTYLYPSEFDPTFTFFGYAALVLGGFASYLGVVLGSLVLWSLIEGLRFVSLPLAAGQLASLRFVLVGLLLIALSLWRPQGLLGRRAEMRMRR
jgi:ABC-type branched-subunit amino acid transport system permease subunit